MTTIPKSGYIFFDDAQISSKTPSLDPSSVSRHEDMIKTMPKAKDRADVAVFQQMRSAASDDASQKAAISSPIALRSP